MTMLTYVERLAAMVTQIEDAIKDRKTNEFKRFYYDIFTYDLAERTQRMALIERVADDYVKAHADVNQEILDRWVEGGCKGDRPVSIRLDAAMLDRLAHAILDEEISDTHPDKMTRNEYPIMSPRQEKTRRDREYSLSLAENYDTDGVNRGKPERRHRTAREERFIERASRNKNRARNAQYKRDTSPGPLITYNLNDTGGELAEDFVACRDIAALWNERLSLVY